MSDNEFDIKQKTNKYFPFYHTTYEKGNIVGCVKNNKISCKECMCKTFCLCFN